MLFEIKPTIHTITVEISCSQMPPTDQVMDALRKHFLSIHRKLTVGLVPPRSVANSDDTPMEIKVSYNPEDGVRLNEDIVLSNIELALLGRFGYAVSITNNPSYRL